MAEEGTLIRRVVVEGYVQGVGYREFTRRAAMRLNVSGWVRNRPDGAVEALLHGAPGDVEALIAEMRSGPRAARVAGIKFIPAEGADIASDTSFMIRPSF